MFSSPTVNMRGEPRIFQVLSLYGMKLRILPSPRAYIGCARPTIPTYFFIFLHIHVLLHIFHIFLILLHIFHIFLHFSFIFLFLSSMYKPTYIEHFQVVLGERGGTRRFQVVTRVSDISPNLTSSTKGGGDAIRRFQNNPSLPARVTLEIFQSPNF